MSGALDVPLGILEDWIPTFVGMTKWGDRRLVVDSLESLSLKPGEV